MKRVSIPTVVAALLLVAILAAYMCTFQVSFYQNAVKVRLGRADESSVIREPGVRLKWPPPIETVKVYDTRLRTLDAPEAEVKTQDGKQLIVATYCVWRIDDPLRFYNRAKEVSRAEEQMRARISQTQAAAVGRKSLPYFVNLDAKTVDANYDAFVTEMRDGVADGLLEDFGIRVQEIGIRRISLPKEVTQKVFESMVQDRKQLAARYREEGKSQADAIRARAESDAASILAFADLKAQEIRSAGVQASTRILAQIEATDREFFEWMQWLEALRESLAQRTTVFLDMKSPLFEPFVNPLAALPKRPEGPSAPTPDDAQAAPSDAVGSR